MRIALCNEVIGELGVTAQCEFAAALGYDGLEVAPFTLGGERKRLREVAGNAGIEIVGLHWLLVTPPGLSITSPDDTVRARTVDIMRRLVDLCADLGGRIMVHGSPE